MALRRILPVVLALAACTPDVGTRTNPTSADFAVFDPSGGRLPLPNDLALRESSRAAQQGAQRELLDAFAATGGFPNDQEVPITIQFERQTVDRNGGITGAAPAPIDPVTLRVNTGANATVLLLEKAAGAASPAPVNPATLEAPSYDATTGTLTIRPKMHAVTLSPGNVIQSRRWNAGSQYIVLVRGGANGVRTQGGGDVLQMKTLYVMTRGLDLSLPENQRLLPVAPGSSGRQGRAITGEQLEQLRQSYLPLFNFVDAASGWGADASKELLSIQTFQIAPVTGGAVLTDASAGKVPLPSDLLLDPATNKVVNNPAFGPLAAGLATLDGFSTTAMALAPTTAPVIAATVNKDTVFIYDLSNPAAPVRLKEVEEGTTAAPAQFWAEPYLITQKPTGATSTAQCTPIDARTGCFSTAIGLQPAAPAVKSDGTEVFLPPFKEATEYAVLVTDGVKVAPATQGAQPTALQRSTLARLLLFASPLVDASGKSQVSGQSDATAAGLEKIRQGVAAAAAALQAEKGIAKDRIVLGYTYRTQTITGRQNLTDPSAPRGALQLAALPYQPGTLSAGSPLCAGLAAAIQAPASLDCTKPIGTPAVAATAAQIDAVFAKWGVESVAGATTTLPGRNPATIGAIIETQLATVNLLDDATGAFVADPTKAKPEVLKALVVVPSAAAAAAAGQTCSGALAPFAAAGKTCVPVALYFHGLGRSRGDVLALAEKFAAKGVALAAIDAPKEGERSWCNPQGRANPAGGANIPECLPPAQCVPNPAWAGQGDAEGARPGTCQNAGQPGDYFRTPVLCATSPGTNCGFVLGAQGAPIASSEYLVTGNFFRLRDSLRQWIVDWAAVTQALVPAPTATLPTGNAVYDELFANRAIVLDPARITIVGESLGAIQGGVNLAVNSRVSRGALSTPGGTMVDALTTAPTYKASVDALFLSLGIDRNQISTNPAVAASYLQALSVAKWILDPADPLNFARYVAGADRLPQLVPPSAQPQPAKAVMTQLALCDQDVPHPFGALHSALLGIPDVTIAPPPPAPTGRLQWYVNPLNTTVLPPSAAYPAGCTNGVDHAFIRKFGAKTGAPQSAAEASLTGKAQDFAADFVRSTAADAAVPTLVTP